VDSNFFLETWIRLQKLTQRHSELSFFFVKVESSGLYLFSFPFLRVRVTRSHCHTSVTSDDTVTVMVTSHKIYRRT